MQSFEIPARSHDVHEHWRCLQQVITITRVASPSPSTVHRDETCFIISGSSGFLSHKYQAWRAQRVLLVWGSMLIEPRLMTLSSVGDLFQIDIMVELMLYFEEPPDSFLTDMPS